MSIKKILRALGAGGLLEQAPQAVFETELSHTFISIIVGFRSFWQRIYQPLFWNYYGLSSYLHFHINKLDFM